MKKCCEQSTGWRDNLQVGGEVARGQVGSEVRQVGLSGRRGPSWTPSSVTAKEAAGKAGLAGGRESRGRGADGRGPLPSPSFNGIC